MNRVVAGWASLVVTYPLTVFCVYFVVTGFLTSWVGYFHSCNVSFDAKKGFETRNQPLADARLTLELLSESSAYPAELLKPLITEEKVENNLTRFRRALETADEITPPPDNFTINYDDYGVDDENDTIVDTPCKVYYALGKDKLPYDIIDGLSKIIFEIDSFESLFTLPVMKHLCRLDEVIDRVVNETGLMEFLSPVPYSFHLPFYAFCTNMSYVKTCDQLTQGNVDSFKELVLSCLDPNTEDLNCDTNIALQIKDYIIQRPKVPGVIPSGSVYIAAVTNVWNQAVVKSNESEQLRFFGTLMSHLEQNFNGTDGIWIAGMNFLAKETFFRHALFSDIKLAAIAMGTVFVAILVYSTSVTLTFMIIAGMVTAMGSAFYGYTVLGGINFFPFINLLVIVIAIAVGVDDAFILIHLFVKYKNAYKKINDRYYCFDSDSPPIADSSNSYEFEIFPVLTEKTVKTRTKLIRTALRDALCHATVAMFVTSATTAAAFLTNSLSSVIVLRCFGVYAALAVTANYIFVISALPAAMLLLYMPSPTPLPERLRIRWLSEGCRIISKWYVYKLPVIVQKIHLVILALGGVIFIGSLYTLFISPGLRLPENNAMQYLRSTHPFEWFDEFEQQFFNFSAKRQIKLNFYAIWGALPTTDASLFEVSKRGHLASDPNFHFDLKTLEQINYQIHTFRESGIIAPEARLQNTSWISRFIEWTQVCKFSTCCLTPENSIPRQCFHIYYRESLDTISRPALGFFKRARDSPVFEKRTHRFLGYIFQAPSRATFTNIFAKLDEYFTGMQNLQNDSFDPKPLLLSSPDITNLYDILSSLLDSTFFSVMVSVALSAVVIVATTAHCLISLAAVIAIAFAILTIAAALLVSGWTVNVIEATILVVSIGLAFDYTLHLAVAFKSASKIVVIERIRQANESCSIPIALAGFTNILAGAILLFAQTQAFFEIGAFLIVMTIISLASAHGIFASLLHVFNRLPRNHLE